MGGWGKSIKLISVPQIFQWDFTSLSRRLEPPCICSPGLSRLVWLLGHNVEVWEQCVHPPLRLREGLTLLLPAVQTPLSLGHHSMAPWPWHSSSHYTRLPVFFFVLGTRYPCIPNGPTRGTGIVFGSAKTTSPFALSNCELHTSGNLNPSIHCPGILGVPSEAS